MVVRLCVKRGNQKIKMEKKRNDKTRLVHTYRYPTIHFISIMFYETNTHTHKHKYSPIWNNNIM